MRSLTINLGGRHEERYPNLPEDIEVTVDYQIHPGSLMTYHSPPEPAELEVLDIAPTQTEVDILLDGRDLDWLLDTYLEDIHEKVWSYESSIEPDYD